ncbi:MAG TPA: hypothetical protein QGG47_03940 [Acidobacteriota bacterium]|nr:hypothetical protein [Acidobacteriota bacterium]
MRMVSAAGKPQGGTRTLPNVSSAWSSGIAYNPVDDVYLVVSDSASGLVAFFMNGGGRILGSKRTLSKSDGASRPMVAWNGVMGRFVVAWVIRNKLHDKVMLTTVDPAP